MKVIKVMKLTQKSEAEQEMDFGFDRFWFCGTKSSQL